jgi:hypothetical protein
VPVLLADRVLVGEVPQRTGCLCLLPLHI